MYTPLGAHGLGSTFSPSVIRSKTISEKMDPLISSSSSSSSSSNPFIKHIQEISPKFTRRWQMLSVTLWDMLVLEARRTVDKVSFNNFIDSMYQRANGEMSEIDFCTKYQNWIARDSPKRQRKQITLTSFRELLLIKNVEERDLDLLIGLIIHEENKLILGRELYVPSKTNLTDRKQRSKIPRLQRCSHDWILLAEELFFALDVEGHGHLTYDDMFFFALVLRIGLLQKSDKCISTFTTSCLTYDLMSSAGVYFHFSEEALNVSSKYKSKFRSSQDQTNINKVFVTLPMFKKLLITRGIIQDHIVLLINHLRSTSRKFIDLITHSKSLTALDVLINRHYQYKVFRSNLWNKCISHAFENEEVSPLSSILSSSSYELEKCLNSKTRCQDLSKGLDSVTLEELSISKDKLDGEMEYLPSSSMKYENITNLSSMLSDKLEKTLQKAAGSNKSSMKSLGDESILDESLIVDSEIRFNSAIKSYKRLQHLFCIAANLVFIDSLDDLQEEDLHAACIAVIPPEKSITRIVHQLKLDLSTDMSEVVSFKGEEAVDTDAALSQVAQLLEGLILGHDDLEDSILFDLRHDTKSRSQILDMITNLKRHSVRLRSSSNYSNSRSSVPSLLSKTLSDVIEENDDDNRNNVGDKEVSNSNTSNNTIRSSVKKTPRSSNTALSRNNKERSAKVRSPSKSDSNVGIYAQALRDMLRRMSIGNGNDVNVKSLDEVIRLGEEIIEKKATNITSRASPPNKPPSNKRNTVTGSTPPTPPVGIDTQSTTNGASPTAHPRKNRSLPTPPSIATAFGRSTSQFVTPTVKPSPLIRKSRSEVPGNHPGM